MIGRSRESNPGETLRGPSSAICLWIADPVCYTTAKFVRTIGFVNKNARINANMSNFILLKLQFRKFWSSKKKYIFLFGYSTMATRRVPWSRDTTAVYWLSSTLTDSPWRHSLLTKARKGARCSILKKTSCRRCTGACYWRKGIVNLSSSYILQ